MLEIYSLPIIEMTARIKFVTELNKGKLVATDNAAPIACLKEILKLMKFLKI